MLYLLSSALIISQIAIFSSDNSWHNSHRLVQITLVLLLSVLGYSSRNIQKRIAWIFSSFLLLGITSASLSKYPNWALLEVSLYSGIILIFISSSETPNRYPINVWWRILLATVCCCSSIISVRFFTAYTAHLLNSNTGVNIHDLITGFDNPRFLGQFTTLALPILGCSLCTPLNKQFPSLLYKVSFINFFFLWGIAIATGTRGTWLAIGISTILLASVNLCGRIYARMQAYGAATGILISYLTFSLFPTYLDISITNQASDRLTLSLSAREIIWEQALSMTIDNPWLGAGPMHFSALRSVAGAHPHQMFLQWSSEWGIISLLLIVSLLIYSSHGFYIYMKSHSNTVEPNYLRYTGLAASILAALIQSMVDGVFVMPYTQMWLAIIAGLAYGMHQKIHATILPNACTLITKIFNIIILIFSITLVIGAYFSLHSATEMHVEGTQFKPRFWVQGFITTPSTLP